MQLGALFAAGISPDDVFGWPWQKILETSAAVQAYHHDLAARLLSGKSPSLEEARTTAAHAQAVERAAEDARRSGLPMAAVDAARAAAEARAFAREVAGQRFAVNVDPEPAIARLDGPALFAAVRAARARGASADEVKTIMEAGMAGRPLPGEVVAEPPG